MTTLPHCPQCHSQQHAAEIEFCFRCRFPLMLIAGKYRLEKLLAEGGQGAVYLARHTELDLDPLRVIKVVKSELFDQIPNLGARFRREVQVTSALSQRCQHIVRIYDDFGEIPALGRFYVMEHLEGNPLSDLISDPLNLPDLKVCLHIFHQLCDAMRFAHREDIIHRDLKPDNLMLVAFEDEPLYLKVLDFGIARPTGEQDEATPKLTQGVVGTPQYMAPEQLTGQPVDARADLYAMGVILYEMLTGQTPHAVKGAGQEAFFELVMSRLKDDPLAPSAVRPDLEIHPAMDEVVMTLLKRTPEERYPRVEVLKAALRSAAREVRRNAKTVLQDTRPEFSDDISDAALHFDLASLSHTPTDRPPTLGYDGSIDVDDGDTPHESPPPAMMTPDMGLQELPIPVIPAGGVVHIDDSPNVNLSDSFEEEAATKVGASPPVVAPMPMPLAAPPVEDVPVEDVPVEASVLPLLSEEEFDDETAVDMSPDAQAWLQSVKGMNDENPINAPTKESPSFHRPIDDELPATNQKARVIGIVVGVVLTLVLVLGWLWWAARKPKEAPTRPRPPLLRAGASGAQQGLPRKRPAATNPRPAARPAAPIVSPLPMPLRRSRRAVPRRARVRYVPSRRRKRFPRRPLRRAVRRPAPRRVASCPASGGGIHWLHIKVSPANARIRHMFGATSFSPAPAKGQRCTGLRGRVKLKLSAPGYDSCMVLLSKKTPRRLRLRLKRRSPDGLQIGGGDYCKGRW